MHRTMVWVSIVLELSGIACSKGSVPEIGEGIRGGEFVVSNPMLDSKEKGQVDEEIRVKEISGLFHPGELEGWRVVFSYGGQLEQCPVRMLYSDMLEEVSTELPQEGVEFVKLNYEEVEGVPEELKFAQVALLKDGSLLDRHVGVSHPRNYMAVEKNRSAVMHLLARNGLVDSEPAEYLITPVNMKENWDTFDGWIMSAYDFSGYELNEYGFRGATLSGVSFQGASLRDADMRGARFYGVDLRTADLRGALIDDTEWLRTWCPDGTLSDENGGTCAGHLYSSQLSSE